MSFLFPVFNWFSTNKYAAWIGGAFLLFFLGKVRDNHLETKHRREEREKIRSKNIVEQAKAEAELDATVSNIIKEEKESHDEAVEARDTAIAPDTADKLPDEIRNHFIRD